MLPRHARIRPDAFSCHRPVRPAAGLRESGGEGHQGRRQRLLLTGSGGTSAPPSATTAWPSSTDQFAPLGPEDPGSAEAALAQAVRFVINTTGKATTPGQPRFRRKPRPSWPLERAQRLLTGARRVRRIPPVTGKALPVVTSSKGSRLVNGEGSPIHPGIGHTDGDSVICSRGATRAMRRTYFATCSRSWIWRAVGASSS